MNIVKITEKQQEFYRDEPSDPLSSDTESFKYKTSITGNTYNVGEKITDDDGNEVDNGKYDANKVGKNETEVVIPLKHLSNFWRSLNIPLINCAVELILIWSKNCVLADMTVDAAANPAIVAPVTSTFEITDTKLYVPVVILSKENDKKLLEQLKSGFKGNIKWKKYRSQMTIQPKNNNLNYLIDPTFTNVNRLFVLPFTRTDIRDYRNIFSHYYVPDAEIKDFSVLIDRKSFFDLTVKNKEEAYEKFVEMSNNNDYKTGNLLDFAYSKKHCKSIAIDLSKQTKLKEPKQINFIGKLSNILGATMFFIIKKPEEKTFNFSQNSVTII